MQINIKKIPILWTSCEKDSLKARNEQMEKMMFSLGFNAKRINGPMTTPYTIGVAQGYINMLMTYKAPFLSFEDDARVCPGIAIEEELDIPYNADAVYLGTSFFGRLKKQSIPNGAICANYDQKYLRSFNMLGFHSILYVNQEYVDACINYLQQWIANGAIGGCDDPIAEKMHRHNVYCLKKPWFFQDDGHSNHATLQTIEPLL
jgi:hypothetical protein